MKHLLIGIALIFPFLSQSQTKLDSLKGVWLDETKADTLRLDAIYDIAWSYLSSDLDSVFYYTKQGKDLAIKNNHNKHMSNMANAEGYAYKYLGNTSEELKAYEESLTFAEDAGYLRGMSNAYINIASLYKSQGNLNLALNFAKKAYAIDSKSSNKSDLTYTLNLLGIIARNMGDNSKALNYYQQVFRISERLKNQELTASTFGNIGNLYYQQNEYKNALQYYEQGLKIYETLNMKELAVDFTHTIALTYTKIDNYEKAFDVAKRALELAQEINYESGRMYSLSVLGSYYLHKKDYNSALEHLESSLAISRELQYDMDTSNFLIAIGEIYLEKRQARKSIDNCQESFDLAIKMGITELQLSSSNCLYTAYKDIGNEEKALLYLEKNLVAKDSLNEVDTAKKLQRYEFNKEKLKDSLQNEEAKLKTEMAHQAEVRKKDKNRNIALGAGLFFLLISGGMYSRYRFTKKAKADIEKEKDRSENLLLNILPAEVAEELKEKGEAKAQDFEMVSILFSDFKGFTGMSEKLSAKDLVANINECFKGFDNTMHKFNIEKIKTIGDAYMAAGGLPVNSETSVKNTVLAALEMQDFIMKLHKEKEAKGEHAFEMRVGIHTGPVVAGIVGIKKFQYDIWGDTVNTASRMESSGEVGKVNISQDTYNYIKDEPEFVFEHRGNIKAKGKGEIAMYFVSRSFSEG